MKVSPIVCLPIIFVACAAPEAAPKAPSLWKPNPAVNVGDPLNTTGAPVMIDIDDVEIINRPNPGPYPTQARENKIQGDVLVEVWIDERGVPFKSTSLWGPQELRAYSQNYALQWRFKPYKKAGTPIPVRVRLRMPFRLIY